MHVCGVIVRSPSIGKSIPEVHLWPVLLKFYHHKVTLQSAAYRTIVIYDRFIGLATVITIVIYDRTAITIVNYDRKTFTVQATE